ncbi:MAG: DUF1648 domain-containing protein [Natrialbaceae archaeon]|nr:DUF1648 domain-containing protein [Natrialbaceae archaeon]
MATHWNAAGEPDGTMGKLLALAVFPSIAAMLLVIFATIPRIDPLRENIASFRPIYDWFVVVFTAVLTVIHTGIIAFNLGYTFDFTQLVLIAVALLLYFTGILLAHAERNWFIGIRTPWTLSSAVVWGTHSPAGQYPLQSHCRQRAGGSTLRDIRGLLLGRTGPAHHWVHDGLLLLPVRRAVSRKTPNSTHSNR